MVRMISYPDALVLEVQERPTSYTITIQAHAADTPRLIGEAGRNYRAIASMMSLIGGRARHRIHIPPIKEPVVGVHERYQFCPDLHWPKEDLRSLLCRVARAMFEHPEAVRVEMEDIEATLSTNVQILVAKTEATAMVKAAQDCLTVLWDAIGKANGRLLYLDVVPGVELELQPPKSDGRFAGEVG